MNKYDVYHFNVFKSELELNSLHELAFLQHHVGYFVWRYILLIAIINLRIVLI